MIANAQKEKIKFLGEFTEKKIELTDNRKIKQYKKAGQYRLMKLTASNKLLWCPKSVCILSLLFYIVNLLCESTHR